MSPEQNINAARTCLHCEKRLFGRLDQKFCDAQCRNAYHNRHKRADERYMANVNAQIRKNRRILKDLCPEGKSTVRRTVLEERGYDYRYFSGIFESKAGVTYYLCYDFGFAPIHDNGKEKVLIIQKQNYMDDYQINPWSTSPG